MYTLSIAPKLRTILDQANQTTVRLPGYDLWMTYIENLYVIPARVDIPRFSLAVGEALQFYPHASGKLHESGGEWEILLTNTPVGLEIEESDGPSNGFGLDNWVVQSTLRRFFRDRANQSDARHSDMLHFKLTIAPQETAIGVSWHHTLGDANVLCRFMQLISQRYQGVRQGSMSLPSFDKKEFGVPDSSLVARFAPLMPHLSPTYPVAEPVQRYREMNRDAGRVAFKITEQQLRRIQQHIMGDQDTTLRLSLQDCLTAYVVVVLNRFLAVPIHKITNAASYRSVFGAVKSTNVAGNAIYIIPTSFETKNTSIKDVACSLRQSILKWREGTLLEEYMTVASHLMRSAANEGRSMFFGAPPGHASVNSHLAIDWQSAHFGFPSQIRFYTAGINVRYIRVFWSNLDRGEKLGLETMRSIDVFFAVTPSSIKDDVLEAIASDLQSPDFPHNIL